MRLIYHPDAEAELIEAAQFYEQRVPGFGMQFLDAAERAVCTIQSDPNRSRLTEAGARQYLMPRFPYAIFYRVFADHVRILAFKHHSRDPGYWRSRLLD